MRQNGNMNQFNTIFVSPVGEPGSGKSTFSMWLCHELKMRGIKAEFVPEVIKYESFTAQARARVVSGLYDERLLRRQHAATLPLAGNVEVVCNDGALEPFFYYSMLRVKEPRLSGLRKQMDRYLEQTSGFEHRWVSPVRQHAYDTTGRGQTEEEARQMRAHLLGTLNREFGIEPVLLHTQQDRQRYLDDLVQDVLTRRAEPAPTRRRSIGHA